jgi:hypothetical protein
MNGGIAASLCTALVEEEAEEEAAAAGDDGDAGDNADDAMRSTVLDDGFLQHFRRRAAFSLSLSPPRTQNNHNNEKQNKRDRDKQQTIESRVENCISDLVLLLASSQPCAYRHAYA